MKDLEGYINKVVQGDCLEVMKNFPDGSIDMILCDLPYGTTQNKWDSVIPLTTLEPLRMADVAAVPEPTSIGIAAIASCVLVAARRRR